MYQPGMTIMRDGNLLGLDRAQMEALAVSMGEPPFRGRQLFHQIYRRKQTDFALMTELPKAFRQRLAEECKVELPRVHRRSDSTDGTVKFLFELADGRRIESVYIPDLDRQTLCISSQVGCDVGCTFCLTAQMGFERNLTPGEIVGQVLAVIQSGALREHGFNIVFMGMGEPLYNYKNVIHAFRVMTDQEGMDLSQRRITVSTAGVVPVLRKMREEPSLPNLAISLNATREELRDEIMPINRKWNLRELLQACRELPLEPRRRITFEYVLMGGVTDSDEDARALARLLGGLKAKVNLIPYNPNPGLPYRRPDPDRVERFKDILADLHISAFVRRPRGDDISAACGQLAYLEKVAG